jgi:hypothetical protein
MGFCVLRNERQEKRKLWCRCWGTAAYIWTLRWEARDNEGNGPVCAVITTTLDRVDLPSPGGARSTRGARRSTPGATCYDSLDGNDNFQEHSLAPLVIFAPTPHYYSKYTGWTGDTRAVSWAAEWLDETDTCRANESLIREEPLEIFGLEAVGSHGGRFEIGQAEARVLGLIRSMMTAATV